MVYRWHLFPSFLWDTPPPQASRTPLLKAMFPENWILRPPSWLARRSLLFYQFGDRNVFAIFPRKRRHGVLLNLTKSVPPFPPSLSFSLFLSPTPAVFHLSPNSSMWHLTLLLFTCRLIVSYWLNHTSLCSFFLNSVNVLWSLPNLFATLKNLVT